MPDQELLPPPPKKKQSVSEEGLLPPPPKKKIQDGTGTTLKTGGTVGSSAPQSVNATNPFAIGGQYNQPPKLEAERLDLSDTNKKAAIAEQIKTPLKKIPLTPILDKTKIEKPISEIDAKEAIARQAQHKKDLETAIDNTTLKVLKQKGIVAGKGSPYYERERKAIEEKTKPTMIGGIVVNGPEATYHKDKDGNIGLDRNLGFIEGMRRDFNAAVDGEDEANAFAGMTTEQKVEYANQKMQENPNTEYMSERSGVGGLVGGSIPYLTRAAFAGTLATAAAIAAPETGGLSMAGAAPVLTVLLTAPDMIKQGAKDEVMTRYMQLKQERPDIPDTELMKIAESGEISGGIMGAAEALAFTTTLKLPIFKDSENVLKTYLKGVASSAVHLGGIMSGTTAAQLAERKIEGYNVDTEKAIDEVITAFTENATAGAILNGLISGAHTLPKVVKSAFKYSLKDTPTSEIKTALDANVQAGRIPPEVAEQTIADIDGYKAALAKTADGLKPETQASVAGLIQARDNVVAEMATKDPTQRTAYEQKIEALNKQIEKITETNDPLKYEVDEVTGKTLSDAPELNTTGFTHVADEVKIPAYKEVFKNGSTEDVKEALKDVSDQWHDEGTQKTTEKNFPKEIIEAAKTEFPQEVQKSLSTETEPADAVVETPSVVSDVVVDKNDLKDTESTAKALDDIFWENKNRSDAKVKQLELIDLIPKEQVDDPNLNGFYKTTKYTIDEVSKLPKDAQDRLIQMNETFKNRQKEVVISEAYHRAKLDGSNPELVKAVEQSLSKEQPQEVVEPKPEIKNEEAKVTPDTNAETKTGEQQKVVDEPAQPTGGKKEPPKEPTEPVGEAEGKKEGITHAAVEELRKIIGEPEYEGKPVEKHEQLIEEAQKAIKDNPNAANEVLDKMENKGKITNKDNAIAAIYKATIDAEMAKNPTPELLKRATRLAKALDVSGTDLGKALESRKLVGKEDNLTNFLLDKQAAQGTALTETQLKTEAKKYEDLKAAYDALEKQSKIDKEQYAKDIAEMGLNKAKAKAKKAAKKSDAEYKAERKEIVDAARKALKDIRDNPQSSTAPLFRELVAIAPHVKKFMESIANNTADKFDNILTDIHAEFKDVLDGLTKRNVLDILAGEYDTAPKGQTRNEKANSIRLLKREAELLKQLERERKGEEKAKSESAKTQSNRRIDELKEKIKEVRRLNKERIADDEGVSEKSDYAKLKEDAPKEEPAKPELSAAEKNIKKLEKELEDLQNGIAKQKSPSRELSDKEKDLKEQIFEARANMGLIASNPVKEPLSDNAIAQERLEKKIKQLESDIKNKKYLEEKKPDPVFRKNRKTQILEDRVIDLENKIRHERSLDEYNKRSKLTKYFDKFMEVLGLRRLFQSALDMSVPFRQGATMISPRKIDVWVKGFQANLKSVFNPKKFERIQYEIRRDPQYNEMIQDNIRFNDMNSADPLLHNEDFRKSFIYKIPIISEPLKASNRSADAFLNTTRYEMYKKMRNNLEKKGYTRESDPEAFKDIGNWVMNMTGSGKKHKIFDSQSMNRALGNTFYGANLMASRLNLLNPLTYFDARRPKAVRYEAMKDMVAFTTTMVTVATALSYITGAKISINPDDSDFLQLRYGDKVYDISGGLANYVRTGLRIGKAAYTKSTGTKYEGQKATDNAGKSVLNFFRNKLSPNTAYSVDAFLGGRYGNEFDPIDIARIYPMYTEDFLKAVKEEGGLLATSTVLLPNILGIGYGSYASKGQIDTNLDDLLERNMRSDAMNNEKIFNYKDGGRQVTDKEFDEFAKKRDAAIKKDIEILFKDGIGKTAYKDLTPEQVADEIKYIKATATREVKEELFGKHKKTRQEKKETKQLQKEHKEKYKNN